MAKASQTRRTTRRRVTARIRRKSPAGKTRCNMCHGTGYVKRSPRKGR